MRTQPPDFLLDLEQTLEHLEVTQFKAATEHTPLRMDFLPDLSAALLSATADARRNAENALDAHIARLRDSPLVGSVSVFRALGFRRDEVAHTKSLAWLLDPTQGHGFGEEVLRCFLRALICDDAELLSHREFILEHLSARVRVSAEHRLTTSCRADVLVEAPDVGEDNWTLVVEAKVDASERRNQLTELLASAPRGRKLGVFLTIDGSAGKTADAAWARLTYSGWAAHLIALMPSVEGRPGSPFLRMYVTGVLEDICGVRCAQTAGDIIKLNNPFVIEQILGVQ